MLRAYPMASRSAKNRASVKLSGLSAKGTRAVLQSGFFYVCNRVFFMQGFGWLNHRKMNAELQQIQNLYVQVLEK